MNPMAWASEGTFTGHGRSLIAIATCAMLMGFLAPPTPVTPDAGGAAVNDTVQSRGQCELKRLHDESEVMALITCFLVAIDGR